MAWDSSRRIPWRRLATEFVLFCAITAVVFYAVLGQRRLGAYLGLPIGAALYVGFGAILAKFGYQRKTLRQLREETRAREAAKAAAAGRSGSSARASRPAATSRTNAANRQRRR